MWTEIIFRDVSSPKRYEVVRGEYEKGSYTCFTLVQRDADGHHIIMKHPTQLVFSIGQPHLPHVGSTLASKKPKTQL